MEKETDRPSLLDRWKKSAKKSVVGLEKAPDNASIPLTGPQQRLWFLQQLFPGNPFYNFSAIYRFEGKLRRPEMLKALGLLFKEYPVLRSYYPLVNGQPVYAEAPEGPIPMDKEDLSAMSSEAAEVRSKEIMQHHAGRPFDLARPPLCRLLLIKLPDDANILFITLHHIITDTWSLELFESKLGEYYQAFCAGSEPPSSEHSIQFPDYAYWRQRRPLDADKLNFWKQELSGEAPILNLPTDYRKPATPAFKGRQYTHRFSREFSQRILAFSRELEVTPFVFLLTVYLVQLSKYCGQRDISIGTPISGRNDKNLEHIFGFFLDTIVLRNQVDPDLTFRSLAQIVRTKTLQAFSNSEVSFEELIKAINPERSLTVNPFFQVMFLYHTQHEPASFGPDLRLVEASEYDAGVAKFDLTLYVMEQNEFLSCTWEYDTELFATQTIAGFQEHYGILLGNVMADADKPLFKVSMLTEGERNSLLPPKDGKLRPWSEHRTLDQIISETALHHSGKDAVIFKDRTLSYEALNRWANASANRILESTQGRHETIGICMERSVEMVVGILAILKAGCAYMPIDPEYPAERIHFMLEDSGATHLLTQSHLADIFTDFKGTLIRIETQPDTSVNPPSVFRDRSSDDLAYIIYTSGSTGRPKGVPITHGNLHYSTGARLDFYPESPEVFLLMSSISFDSSMVGLFWTLCTGGALVIGEKRIEQDVDQITEIIDRHDVSHTLMLPSLYGLILEHGESARLGSLKAVIVAGETCQPQLATAHCKVLPDTPLYNEYGPTEATVWCIAHKVTENDLKSTVPIGKPIDGARVVILDERMQPVPSGAVGELYVGGMGLSKGYLNRDDLNAKAFIDDPFSSQVDQKLYKTGDLVRYRWDGNLMFLGRADQQVKIRGYRIELDEIESVLNESPMVEQTVVLVEEHERTPEGDGNVEDIANYLQKSFEDAEIESLFSLISNMDAVEKRYMTDQIRLGNADPGAP